MSRTAAHPIESFLLERWSPRAMDGTPLSHEEMHRLLEAARWAPSGGNLQPWRIVYALAGTPHFEAFFGLLAPGNQTWCSQAGALAVVLADMRGYNGQPSRSAPLDTGAAWMALALQGSAMDLVVHGMGGFDYDRAHALVGATASHQVQMMIAIGHHGKLEDLSEALQQRESPSDRKQQAEWSFEGKLPAAE